MEHRQRKYFETAAKWNRCPTCHDNQHQQITRLNYPSSGRPDRLLRRVANTTVNSDNHFHVAFKITAVRRLAVPVSGSGTAFDGTGGTLTGALATL